MKSLEHPFDVCVGRFGPVFVYPTLSHGRDLADQSDVDSFVGAHRNASLFDADRDTCLFEDLTEDDGRRHASKVHRRTGPIEDDGADRTAEGAIVGEFAFVGKHGSVQVFAFSLYQGCGHTVGAIQVVSRPRSTDACSTRTGFVLADGQ